MHSHFPKARIARLDRDTVSRKRQFETILSGFREHAYDILVGTQMIAKGHDIPNVTLVGVISADIGLGMPDFRAGERTFQLLTQVAGRVPTEASGGISLETIREAAETGVTYISVGRITQSAPAVDIGLDFSAV